MTQGNSNWQFVLTDYLGNEWGPVFKANQRNYAHPLDGMRTASLSFDLDNPATQFIFNPPTLANGLPSYPLLKVYRTNRKGQRQHLMTGDVASIKVGNQSSEGMSQVTVVAADGLWRLAKRLIGMGNDTKGRGTGYTYASAGNQAPISQIIADILNDTNIIAGPSGVLVGSVPTNVVLGAVSPAVYQQQVATYIAQLSALVGGPDYEITPMEPITPPGQVVANIGTLNQYSWLGSVKSNVVFEYGVGQKNVSNYELNWDRTGHITKAWSLPQGFPDAVAAGDGIVSAVDTNAETAWGIWEDAISSDFSSQSLRKTLCQDYVTVRRYARNQITFIPSNNCNIDYGADYLPGDIVGASAVDQDVIIYDGTVRIYGCTFSISDNEEESVSLTLIPQGS